MRKISSFWWLCVKRACEGTSNRNFGNDWQWAFGNTGLAALLYAIAATMGRKEMSIPSDTWWGALLAGAAAFLITWLIRFAARLFSEPAHLYYRELARANTSEAKYKAIFEPERDTWLRDAVWYLTFGRWPSGGEFFSNSLKNEPIFEKVIDSIRELRQKAVDTQLTIWGIKHRYQPGYEGFPFTLRTDRVFDSIIFTYWLDHYIDWQYIEYEADHLYSTKSGSYHLGDESYFALQVSRSQVEALWPPVVQEEDSVNVRGQVSKPRRGSQAWSTKALLRGTSIRSRTRQILSASRCYVYRRFRR